MSANPEVKSPEGDPASEEPKVDVKALLQKNAELEEKIKEHANRQSGLDKREARLNQLEGLTTELKALREEFQNQKLFIAEVADSLRLAPSDDEDETPKKAKSESFTEKVRKEREQAKPQIDPMVAREQGRIEAIIEDANIDVSSEVFAPILKLFNAGKYSEARADAKKLVKQMKETTTLEQSNAGQKAKTLDQLTEDEFLAEVQKRGLIKTKPTTPSASGSLTLEDVKRMSPEEKMRRRSEIAKLPLGIG